MNPLREWRRLRAVPDSKPVPSHSAGDERPSLAVVPGVRRNLIDDLFPADALDDAPPVEPVRVSARPSDPTPIWDAVMGDKWWHQMDDEECDPYHALATQFEVAFILDEFTDDDRAEIAREAAEDVSFGWLP